MDNVFLFFLIQILHYYSVHLRTLKSKCCLFTSRKKMGSSLPISVDDLSFCLEVEVSLSYFPNSQALYSCSTKDFILYLSLSCELVFGSPFSHHTHLFPLVCFQREVQCSSSLQPLTLRMAWQIEPLLSFSHSFRANFPSLHWHCF